MSSQVLKVTMDPLTFEGHAEMKEQIVYKLIDSTEHIQVVYIGETDDIERRFREHKNEGKIFDKYDVISTRSITKSEAQTLEKQVLRQHIQAHGILPKYNKDSDG